MARVPLSKTLKDLDKQSAYRKRLKVESPQGVNIVVEGKQLLSFCSNDYLGLANDSRVCNTAVEAIKRFGLGSGASQLVSGYSTEHFALEEELADFLGYSRCVLFSSGYLANLGVLSAFSTNNSLLLEDKLNHASLIDAALSSSGTLKRYRHRDMDHANTLLDQYGSMQPLLITDGVFSMEGSIAPIDKLSKLKDKYSGMAIVDDSHGIGVMGNKGRGTLEYLGVKPSNIDILIGTFGKAFGCSGAFVVGENDEIEYLIQAARTLIYSTAAPAALAAANRQSLSIIISEPERRDRLHSNINYFRSRLSDIDLELLSSSSAIQSIIIGSNQQVIDYSQRLYNQGFLVTAIRPPTVPKGTARLRVTLCSEHTFEHIDKLTDALKKIL